MNVIDFGQNSFQSELVLKLDVISPDYILAVARSFLTTSGWLLGKDPQSGQSVIYVGDGTPKNPFLQIKLSADRVILWAGWHVSYEAWIRWRSDVIRHLLSLSNNLSSSFVGQLNTHSFIVVPFAKLKKVTDIPEFKHLLEFTRKYVPEEYMARIASQSLFSNNAATRIIETQVAGNPTNQTNTFTYAHRWTDVNSQVSIQQNLTEHFTLYDQSLERYRSAFLDLIVMKP